MFYIILAIIGLTRNALSFLGKDSTLINQNMVNCYCPLHCNKRVPFSQTNESPMDNHNQIPITGPQEAFSWWGAE